MFSFDVIGMMPAMIGTADAGQLATLAKVVEIAVAEEELGADVIRAGVDLPLEVIHLLKPVRGTRDAPRESRRRRCRTRAGRASPVRSRMKRTSCSAYWKASHERS